jgi:hypothetical protein
MMSWHEIAASLFEALLYILIIYFILSMIGAMR